MATREELSTSFETRVEEAAQSSHNAYDKLFIFKLLIAIITVISAIMVVWQLFEVNRSVPLLAAMIVIFVLSAVLTMRLLLDPESIRAHQSDLMLRLSRQVFECLTGGFDEAAAQKICELLLPTTDAVAVAICDSEKMLGFTSDSPALNRNAAKSIKNDEELKFQTADEMVIIENVPSSAFKGNRLIKAAVFVPLRLSDNSVGSLRFYYSSARKISSLQKSIAEGLGQLISTQIAAQALEEQTKLATTMELKALQNQINPHFLFNTINTIASLIRTDPMKARTLLREFAVFYRRTLEDSDGLILLSREAEQTVRYFQFELARFGEDRLELILDEEEGVQDMLVPPFLIQPLVENAVRHAMPSEGKLTIVLSAWVEGEFLKIRVADNGVGMSEETCANIMHPESSTGMGIAVKNVHDRIIGYFGPQSGMDVQSKLGEGTQVTLSLSLVEIERYV